MRLHRNLFQTSKNQPGQVELAPYFGIGFVENVDQLLILHKVHLLLFLLLLLFLIGQLFLVDLEHEDVLLVELIDLVRLNPENRLEVLFVQRHIHLLEVIVNQTVPEEQNQKSQKKQNPIVPTGTQRRAPDGQASAQCPLS